MASHRRSWEFIPIKKQCPLQLPKLFIQGGTVSSLGVSGLLGILQLALPSQVSLKRCSPLVLPIRKPFDSPIYEPQGFEKAICRNFPRKDANLYDLFTDAISLLFEVKPLADYFFISSSPFSYEKGESSLCERFAIS
jgi:hypothetical protein